MAETPHYMSLADVDERIRKLEMEKEALWKMRRELLCRIHSSATESHAVGGALSSVFKSGSPSVSVGVPLSSPAHPRHSFPAATTAFAPFLPPPPTDDSCPDGPEDISASASGPHSTSPGRPPQLSVSPGLLGKQPVGLVASSGQPPQHHAPPALPPQPLGHTTANGTQAQKPVEPGTGGDPSSGQTGVSTLAVSPAPELLGGQVAQFFRQAKGFRCVKRGGPKSPFFVVFCGPAEAEAALKHTGGFLIVGNARLRVQKSNTPTKL